MSTSNRLTPLLAPTSIALVGGSPREGTVGNMMIKSLRAGGYSGVMSVVNPRYETVEGLPCVGAISELEASPDLAILSVAAHRMERTMADAIKSGARSAVVFDPCFFAGDGQPPLLQRLKSMAREADFPVCGGNGMGYFNYDANVFASFAAPVYTAPGHIAAFCHSGSVFGICAFADPRYRFNLLTSQGQEIGASVADYMDYALDQPTTRVLALFLEAVRDPAAFVAVLEKANRLNIPVAATKIARTQESARLATTHSGAMAGDDSAFDAVCKRYGVLRTQELDELLATAQILAMDRQIGEGGFAALLDSGGLREQMMDVAHELGLEFARLTPETVERLRERIAYGLEPTNPLDAAGPLNDDYAASMVDALHILEADPNVAMLAQEIFLTDQRIYAPDLVEAAKDMPVRSDKPYVLTHSSSTVTNSEVAAGLAESGVPMVNGVRPLLSAVKNAFDHRDFLRRTDDRPAGLPEPVVASWRTRLQTGAPIGESESLRMLNELGVGAVQSRVCDSADVAARLADEIGYPVVLKTAVPGIVHKSDVAGVQVGLETADRVRVAYDRLSELGPEVCVAQTAPGGVEVAFGMVNDVQFGPIVMVSAGGVLVEVVDDRVFALPPFGHTEAKRILLGLKVARMLQGVRGSAPCDIETLASSLSRFSSICVEFGDLIAEMDVNPIIASAQGALAVDTSIALV